MRGARFTLTCAVTPVAGKPWFVCDIVKAVNLGPGPIDVHAFYFRQYVDYFQSKDTGSEQRKVPNLWKATEAAPVPPWLILLLTQLSRSTAS